MSITIPDNYVAIDTGPTGPFSAGQSVTDTGALDDLLNNSNQYYASQGLPIASAFYGLGWTGAALYRDIGVCKRPADPDTRQLTMAIFARYTGGTSANLRVLDDGSSAGTQNVTSSTAAWYTIAFTPNSATEKEVILQADDGDLHVYAWTLYRTVLSGSISDTPKASGWLWTQPSQLAADEPVSVELLNRILRNPYKHYLAQPCSPGGAYDSPGSPRLGWSTSVASEGPHIVGFLHSRHGVPCKLIATGKEVSGTGAIGVQVGAAGGVWSGTLNLEDTSTPSAGGPYTWAESETFYLPPGVHSLHANVEDGEIWTIQALTVPA